MRQHQGHPGKPGQVSGKQQPRDRGRRVGEAADRVDQIVAGEPLVAAHVMRMDEDRRAARRGQFPERVEIGVVEIAAGALRLRRDHRAVKAGVERLFEHAAASAPFCSGTVASADSDGSAAASLAMCSL